MGGYDLYGRYYSNQADAENAEMAQCAQIDSGLNAQEFQKLWYEIQRLNSRIESLEHRTQKE